MTDGCASQVATGAVGLNQWNSTLGTTLVIKGVTRDLIRDPQGRVYCHRHPDGYWQPGGASNTGGECIARKFDTANLDALGEQARKLTPTNIIAYPLMRTGERFPFANPAAEGFFLGDARDEATLYTACLEGVGYVERLAYDVLKGLGAEMTDEICVAGGANKAAAWLQIRADILQKTLLVPAHSGAAMGAAIIAAGGTIYQGIVPAARAMVRIVKRVEPRRELQSAYEERYNRFRVELQKRGYLEKVASDPILEKPEHAEKKKAFETVIEMLRKQVGESSP
jgi:sugar (pentulose or hexulose) kinase